MNIILRAARFAADCHRLQERKYNGRPYITHPCRVAGRVAIHPLADEDAVCAAFLHDVAEDCGVTLADLQADFNYRVADLVGWLTNPSKGSKEPRAVRKSMDREHARSAPEIAKVIKLIDRIDNLREIDPADSFAWLYCEESLALLAVVGDADHSLAGELQQLIKEVQDAHIKATI